MENAACYAPQILVSTEDLPREQWLEYRRKGIGGSDAAAVLGISPFRTGRDLYYDKLNIVTADDAENWVQLEVGTLLEPLVAKIFAHKTGYKIYRRPFMFQHPLYPWMLADLDYMAELPDGIHMLLSHRFDLMRDGKKRQNEEAFILRLISAVGDPLIGQCVILPPIACGIEIPGQLILFHAHIPGHGTSPKWFSIT